MQLARKQECYLLQHKKHPKKPEEMPVTFMEYPDESLMIVDMDTAKALNIEIPKEYITENTKIIENNKIK